MLGIGIGSKTSTGGVVVEGNDGIIFDGKVASSVGHKATCPECKKGEGVIVAVGHRDVSLPAGPAARAGDYVACGCPANSNVLLGEGTVSIGSSSLSENMTQAAQSLSSNPQRQAQSALSNSSTLQHADSQAQSTTAAHIPQDAAYWPPYNPVGKEGEKELNVVYSQEHIRLAVLTIEEATEFAENMWQEHNGKDALDNTKKVWDGAEHAYKASKIAVGLGGLGVTAYAKTINGAEYIIIKGYKKHLKTLVKGHIWKANNPQIVQLGIGTKNMAKQLLKINLVVDIAFAAAINAVDTMVHDEKTMVDFVGRTGADITKGLIAMGAGVGAATFAGGGILLGGVIFALVSVAVGISLDELDNELGVSDKMVEIIKEVSE